jgi:hypothetical protein
VGTYTILFLLGLLMLVVLVYLPKIRKPALWITISLVGLGGVAAGGLWIYQRHQDREYERTHNLELSLLVDHAIGKPPNCKSKPFTVRYDEFSVRQGDPVADPLERAKKRATNKLPETDYDKAIAAGAKPVPRDPAPQQAKWPAGFVPDPPPARRAKTRGSDANPWDAYMAPDPPPARGAKARGSDWVVVNPEPFDPDNYLCEQNVGELATFIKEHGFELNDFIRRSPNDPRVEAVQTALGANGVEFQMTCKNLQDAKLDAYELHKAGCK